MNSIVDRITHTAKDPNKAATFAVGLFSLGISLTLVLVWLDLPKLLALLYPVGATTIGFWLYATQRPLYFGFVWWLWLITPFIRRVVDYLMGNYVAFSLPMLAPYMVTALVFLDIPRFGAMLKKRTFVPFGFLLVALIYGYLVGIAKVGILPATFAFLDWTAPVVLGFHVLVSWDLYPKYKRVLQSVLMWGTFFLGLYGLYQFVSPPPWDALWMSGSGMSSIGQPNPYEIRVFSMLNAPGPYAMVLMAGLLLLLDRHGPLTIVSGLFGYVGLLLSLVRGAWGGLVMGLGLITIGLQGFKRMRLIALLVVVGVLSIPIVSFEPIEAEVGDRAETLRDVGEEGSFKARVALYRTMTVQALSAPIGSGLGSMGWDSGFISVVYKLGWFGALCYFSGMIWLLKEAWKVRKQVNDSFLVYATSIAAVYFSLQLMGIQTMGVKGVVFWTLISITLAGKLYSMKTTNSMPPPEKEATTFNLSDH
jgi:hypothetical protein